ncbi:MAG: hypothetical protein K0Q72_1323 [Armatimonadetes bacterium]|jgi:hypothetical protein|nr:hypothetical protein [Armatimonadota bacterium]
MEDPNSRYSGTGTSLLALPDGRTVAYRRRRFLPQGGALPLLAEVRAGRDERLDLFTYRTLGDPEQFWQVCDANDALRPEDLTAGAERILRVTTPQFPGGASSPDAAAAAITLSLSPGGGS